MTRNSEQFNQSSSTTFSDDAIRRFLLGQLSAADRLLFERLFFEDAGLETRVRLAEYELTDDYAWDRLPLAYRRLFEQKFLLSLARAQKLKVSQILRKRFDPALGAVSFEHENRVISKLRSLVGFTQPRSFAVVVVILLLLMGTLWLLIRAPRFVSKFIARRPPVAKPGPLPLARTPENRSQTLSHHQTSSPIPSPITSDSSDRVEFGRTIVLSPATSIEGGQFPVISPQSDVVRFELSVKANHAPTFRAELQTISGQLVFEAQALKADDTGVPNVYLELPAGLLKASEYQIKLSSSEDSAEEVGRYYFRVQ